MTRQDDWRYGMLEVRYPIGRIPSNEDYFRLVEENIVVKDVLEAELSVKLFGEPVIWTLIRHRKNPAHLLWELHARLAEITHLFDMYAFQMTENLDAIQEYSDDSRYRTYYGMMKVPSSPGVSAQDELENVRNVMEKYANVKVVALGKTFHPERYNLIFAFMSRDGVAEVDELKVQMDRHLKVYDSRLFLGSKHGWHKKKDGESTQEKFQLLVENLPSQFYSEEVFDTSDGPESGP